MKRVICFSTIPILMVMLSCYPDSGFNSTKDYGVTITIYDREFNFSSITTYAMATKVTHIGDSTMQDLITTEYDELILAEIEANMAAAGFNKASTSEADIFVWPWITYTEWRGFNYYPNWGYSGWRFVYPTYWYDYKFFTGTLMIEIDYVNTFLEIGDGYPVIWLGANNGLLNSTSSETAECLQGMIKQCFTQSPYLQAN